MTQRVPPLAERREPGLSETLTGPVARDSCQSCGFRTGWFAGDEQVLQRWQECDEWDKPNGRVVVLCERCTKRLIEPHPRLYISLWPSDPIPGMLDICDDCPHRELTRCKLSRAAGGAGVFLRFNEPAVRAIVCRGRGGGGHVTLYGKVLGCDQKDGARPGERLAPTSPPADIPASPTGGE